jgi:hypothetical protein
VKEPDGVIHRMQKLLGTKPVTATRLHAQERELTGIERAAMEYAEGIEIAQMPICELPRHYLAQEVKLATDDLYVPGTRLPRHIGRWVGGEEEG